MRVDGATSYGGAALSESWRAQHNSHRRPRGRQTVPTILVSRLHRRSKSCEARAGTLKNCPFLFTVLLMSLKSRSFPRPA